MMLLWSRGDMLVATNQETLAASRLFNQSEGIDIDPAAAVALATLIKRPVSTESRGRRVCSSTSSDPPIHYLLGVPKAA